MYGLYTKNAIKNYVGKYGHYIIDAIADTGLYFPAVVAQTSVESRFGESDLATMANNFGGIKGNPTNGMQFDTTEVVNNKRIPTKAWFKKYSSFAEFIKDYVSLLTNNERYKNSGAFQAKTPEEQIRLLVDAGYSTRDANDYLNDGILDRINATKDQFPIGKVNSSGLSLGDAKLSQVYGMAQDVLKPQPQSTIIRK